MQKQPITATRYNECPNCDGYGVEPWDMRRTCEKCVGNGKRKAGSVRDEPL